MKPKIAVGRASIIVIGLLTFGIGMANSGIEHAEKSGPTETAACDAALDSAEEAAKIKIITLLPDSSSGITKKDCKCREHAPKNENDKNVWSCVGIVSWEKRGI